jgi:hypothetical protein
MKKLFETKEKVKSQLEMFLSRLDKGYYSSVAQEFVEEVCAISRKKLMTSQEILPYIIRYEKTLRKYLKIKE